MKTKICGVCKDEKSTDDFHKNPKKKDGIQSMCKVCRKEYHKVHYLKNKQTYLEKASSNHQLALKRINEFKATLKCEECNENRWWVLDFHHLDPTTKEFNIAQLRGYSWDRIMKEVKKCKVLCANCHRNLHYQERINVAVA